MRHVVVTGLLTGLFTVAACSTPVAPMFDTGSTVDAGRDAARDANISDAPLAPDLGIDAAIGLDANDLDTNELDAELDAASDPDVGTDAATVGDAGCASAAACNDGNACTIDVCSGGTCSHAPVAIDDGNVCTMDTCNTTSGAIGHGPIAAIDDGDACTTDTCNTTSGAIGHAPIAGCCNTAAMCTSGVCQTHVCVSAQCTDHVRNGTESDIDCGGSCGDCTIGMTCNANGDCDTGACSAGRCVECNAPTDCGANSECRTRTCIAHVCGMTNTAPGTATTTQMAGDCRENQCDGAGSVVNVARDADVPVDGIQCSRDVCTAGVPSNPPATVGTMCTQSGGTVCNGSGACVQCVLATDCAGTDTECRMRTCTTNTCGVSFVGAGIPTSAQTPNDCHRNQCNGSGAIVVANDDADLPLDDGNQCTFDLCSAGVVTHSPRGAGQSCAQSGGTQCDGAGACVQCNVPSDCGASTTCRTYACTTGMCSHVDAGAGTASGTQTTGDCRHRQCDGAGVEVNAIDDLDLPVDGLQCTMDVCTAGAPSNPPQPAGTPCSQSGGTQCNASSMCITPAGPPTVTATTPADATSVVAGTTLAVTFSTAMNGATLTGQTSAGACSGSIQVSLDDFASCIAFSAAAATMSGGNTIATLTAAPGLLINRTYKIRVTTAAASAGGTMLASQYTHASGFTTNGSGICGASSVVIAQVYGGGGNAGATYTNDYVVLHNRGTTDVSLAGWSIQYGAATNPFTLVTALSGTIRAGGYYLVQEQAGMTVSGALPMPDATGTINMSGTAGRVALVSNTVLLGTTCPTGGGIVDMVGYGTTATCFEGTAAAPAPSNNTTAVMRGGAACTDTGNNASDFATAAAAPVNSALANVTGCGCVWNESSAPSEVDYCNVQFPIPLSVAAGAMSTVYGRIYEAGLTPAAGAPANVRAQLGYGPPSVNPEYQSGWVWTDATYNPGFVDPSNDEYQATFTAPSSGSYRYAYRFSLDNGASWTFCDPDPGAGSNTMPTLTWDLTALPVLTVP